MRNLKKVLSLSLAFVMLLGMMVVGGSAAAYNDADEISNVTASEVMSAIGVFQGDENGDFNPTKALAREEAAKIITYMMMTKTNADKLGTTSDPFTDVAADRWSAGSIAYCVSMGIIAGNGDGTFAPRDTVTGYAFAKMLLVALGYDAKVQGYVGSDWAINVSKDALKAGLGTNVAISNEPLTREDAAQMAFNALTADLVSYPNGKGTEINTGDMSIVVGASAPVVEGVSTLVAGYDNSYDGELQFCEFYFPGLTCTVTAPAADVIGNDAWSYNLDPVTTEYQAPTLTYTKAMSGPNAQQVTNALKNYTISATTALVDGNTGAAISTATDIANLTANGNVVNVYTANGVVNAVTVTTTGLVEITNVTLAGPVKSVTVSAHVDPWFATGLITTVTENDACFDELCAIGKGGFALVTAAYNGASYVITSVAEPEVVTGYVTATDDNGTNNTSVTVGGATYELANSAVAANAAYTVTSDTKLYNLSVNPVSERNVYLDSYGYALYNVDTVVEIDMPNTIYVTKAYTAPDKWNVDQPMVQGVLNDGTVVTVQVAAPVADADVGKLYTYSLNPATGAYILGTQYAVNGTQIGIVDATACTVGPKDKVYDTYYLAADVEFMYISGSGDLLKVDVREGLQVGQAIAATDYFIVGKDANDNYVIKTVLIETAAPAAVAEDLIFIANAWTTTNYKKTMLNSLGNTLYGYEAYLNGEKAIIWVDTAAAQSQGFYEYSTNSVKECTKLEGAAAYHVHTAEALSGITVIGDKYYWDVATTAYDNYDIANAVIVNASTNAELTSAAALKAALTAGKSITVSYGYDSVTDTITTIYVVSCS